MYIYIYKDDILTALQRWRLKKHSGFDVHFDVTEGNIPFLLGLPTMASMGSAINLKYITMSLALCGHYSRLCIIRDGNHVHLPFNTSVVTPVGDTCGKFCDLTYNGGGNNYYSSCEGGDLPNREADAPKAMYSRYNPPPRKDLTRLDAPSEKPSQYTPPGINESVNLQEERTISCPPLSAPVHQRTYDEISPTALVDGIESLYDDGTFQSAERTIPPTTMEQYDVQH